MRVVVVGGGTMGVGIAHRCAASGHRVEIVDLDLATAEAARDRVADTLATAVRRDKLTAEEATEATDRVTALRGIRDVPPGPDFVIEAVVEDPAVKGSILHAAERSDPLVLATNTSSISIDALADGLDRPDRFVGMHFFNPVWAIPLIEVIRGSATSEDTLSTVGRLADTLGMERAVINDAPGFATSRLGVLVGLEAIRMVEEGVGTPRDIDTAMRLGYRHPMGPLMLGDLVGLDVRLAIADHLATVYGDRFSPPALLRDMVEAGHLGKKSGRGFYDWSSGSAEPIEEG